VRYNKQAMIVAPQPEPTEAGADVLREGGNAVDAGIACALVQGVVDPHDVRYCGLRQPAASTCRARNLHGYIDFHAPAPLAARPDMWANLIESEARDGYGFIAEGPGERRRLQVDLRAGQSQDAYHAAQQGARQPALGARSSSRPSHWAEQGWSVRPHVYGFWSDDELAFGRAPELRALTGFTPAAARSTAAPTAARSGWATGS
jgi:gamma-glutamyltranspeptidase/glutathione hydrolase